MAEVWHAARLLRLHVGASGQEAALHGNRVRPASGVLRKSQHRLVAERGMGTPRRATADQGPHRDLQGESRPVEARHGRIRLLLDRRRRPWLECLLVASLGTWWGKNGRR